MSNKEDEFDENYIHAILNLYKEVTEEERRRRLKFRTKMLQSIRKDLNNGKITEETYNKAEEELTWAIANDDMNLEKRGEKVTDNSREDGKETSANKDEDEKVNEREAFKKKLSVQPEQMQEKKLETDDLIRIFRSRNERKSRYERKDQNERKGHKWRKGRKNGKESRNSRGER